MNRPHPMSPQEVEECLAARIDKLEAENAKLRQQADALVKAVDCEAAIHILRGVLRIEMRGTTDPARKRRALRALDAIEGVEEFLFPELKNNEQR